MVELVSVDCEDWACSAEDCYRSMCPRYDPHEMELKEVPKNLRGFFKALGLVYEDDR